MRVPIRKPGKYTFHKPDLNLTQVKFDQLKNQLARLKNSQPQAIAEVQRLAELGDFSENAAYQMAKGRLRSINDRIFELTEYLKLAVIIQSEKDVATVKLGHRVTVGAGDTKKTYLLLGSSETNPARGVISHHSPLGSALLGHQVGDTVKVQSKNSSLEYTIIKIE